MKVAILYLCSGDYSIFWEKFFRSYEKNFLPECHKEYFVFTDKEKIYMEDDCNRIHKFYQKNLGWPLGTLMRFHIFSNIKDKLKNFDYIFFMNANLVCNKKITYNELLNNKYNIYVFKQPGYYNKKPKNFPYDRNKKSTAYIPYNLGQSYVFGAINGGRTAAFLELIDKLKNNVQIDLDNNIYARWLDESHLNRYILDRNDVKVFNPDYCYPEDSNLPFEKKIIVLEKSKYFNVNKIKNIHEEKNGICLRINHIKSKIKTNFCFIRDTILHKRV
ncbi:MAG: family 6 glucosyltransferase [Clostridium sp.]